MFKSSKSIIFKKKTKKDDEVSKKLEELVKKDFAHYGGIKGIQIAGKIIPIEETIKSGNLKEKYNLFDHQVEGIEFAKNHKRVIIADEMGLGKSRQAIIASKEDGAVGTLIICPASLKINWKREIRIVYPTDSVNVVESGKEIILVEAKWIIVNYDMLPKYIGQILTMIEKGDIDTAIVDEAHYIKGKKTIRAVNTLDIITKLDRVYELTGTPIMNRPIEMFNLLKGIRHPIGRARTVYAKRYCGAFLKTIYMKTGRVIRFNDESGATNLQELREFTKDSILRRLKKDVLNLPEKIISVQMCELSKDSRKEYDNAFDAYVEWIVNNQIEKNVENIMDARHLVELMKLKQVCSRAKMQRLITDIRSAVEQGNKVIVFSQFTNSIMSLKEELSKEKRGSAYDDSHEPIKAVTLTGQDDMDSRQKAVDAFQNDEKTKVFIANIKAGGVGITLTKASIVMFADMEWSPEIHSQAEDRAHRIGQEGTVNVYYYIAEDTIEEDIVEILERKRLIIRELIDGDQTGRYTEEMKRIIAIEDEAEREEALKQLEKSMNKNSGSVSMASEFLSRMKTKLGLSTSKLA